MKNGTMKKALTIPLSVKEIEENVRLVSHWDAAAPVLTSFDLTDKESRNAYLRLVSPATCSFFLPLLTHSSA